MAAQHRSVGVVFLVGLTDAAYYEPETFLDYSAALLTTGSAIATAVALWVWGSAQDRRVPTVLLRLAALTNSSWRWSGIGPFSHVGRVGGRGGGRLCASSTQCVV